jgi:hypothetical protein
VREQEAICAKSVTVAELLRGSIPKEKAIPNNAPVAMETQFAQNVMEAEPMEDRPQNISKA